MKYHYDTVLVKSESEDIFGVAGHDCPFLFGPPHKSAQIANVHMGIIIEIFFILTPPTSVGPRPVVLVHRCTSRFIR
jgi:hypothetical protein